MCGLDSLRIGGDRENDLMVRSRLDAARNLGTPEEKSPWLDEKPVEAPMIGPPAPDPTAAPAPRRRPRRVWRPGAPGVIGFAETTDGSAAGPAEEYQPPAVVAPVVAPAVPLRGPTLVPRSRQNSRASAAQMYGPPPYQNPTIP